MYDSSVEGDKPEAGAPELDKKVEHLAEVLHDKMEHLDPTNDGTSPRVTSNSSGCGQSNSSTPRQDMVIVSLPLFPGQEFQRPL